MADFILFHSSWKSRRRTQTLIAGLGPSDLVAPWVVKGAMDGPAFVAYIRDALIPEIEPALP